MATPVAQASALADVAVAGLRKAYGAVDAVDGIDFDVPAGTFFTLLGPFAAAYATVPLVVMGLYLAFAKRLGAFEAL